MTESDQTPNSAQVDEVNLFDLLIVLAKHKKKILLLPLVAAIAAAGYSQILPPIYTATTKILPPQQNQSASAAMLAQLGGLANFVGAGSVLKNPNDVYVAMLGSRTIADNLIQRFDLMKVWDVDSRYPSLARTKLELATQIKSGKDGLIAVEVEDKDPKRAADMANAYVEELINFTGVLAVTEASKRRLFFERQFALAKDNLAKAEGSARQALQTGGLVKVDEQGRAMIENTARLRGQITVKEVQIGAMRTFATDANPNLQMALQELGALKRELAKIEGSDVAISSGKSGASPGGESLRLLRDVKYNEVIFELLARQYEMAKIDEAKESAVIQVMDKATEPDRKSRPNRKLMVISWAVAALVLAVLWAFIRESLAKSAADPSQGPRIVTLKRYLSFRKTA
jgi:tyrosine-protein kinase Etk/Wzc